MFTIDGRLQVGMYIGNPGSEVEINLQDSFVSLQISTMVGMALPTCRIVLMDTHRILQRTGVLADNQLMRIRIATGQGFQNQLDYPFRVFAVQKIQGSAVSAYAVDGYYNYPKYWAAKISRPFRGSSVEAMRNIALQCDMRMITIRNSNDSQVWHPHNLRFSKWAADIAARGYVNDTSCMRHSVGDDGVLRYLDISALDVNPDAPQLVFARDPGNHYRVISHQYLSTTGIDNFSTGYGMRMVQQSVVSDDRNIDRVRVRSDGKPLLINNTVKELLSATGIRRVFAPIDGGNVNSFYTQAMYQNHRLGNTWSSGSKLLLTDRTRYQLLDPVIVQYDPNSQGEPERFQSGKHLVQAKTIYISGGNYYEVLQVLRNTMNTIPGSP